MESTLTVLTQIKQAKGKRKQTVLSQHKDDNLLKEVLDFVYNPYILSGLSDKKINKKDVPAQRFYIKDLSKALTYLKQNNTGTDKDIAIIQGFINSQPTEYWDILKEIFTKSLSIGITAATINKVIPNLIPEFNVMLAEKYWERIDWLKETMPNIIITQKLDGIRCVAKVTDGKVTMFSRQGKAITGLKDIENELSYFQNGVYDGELILDDEMISSDLYRKTVKVVNSDIEYKQNVIFHIFDYLPNIGFDIGRCDLKASERKAFVAIQIAICKPKYLKHVDILYSGIYGDDIVTEFLNQAISNHQEGVMINIDNAPYECKRTKNILKVKMMHTCDLEIIGFEKGSGKYKETLGALVVDYKGNNVSVGSGFTDEDRQYIWDNQDELLGKIVEVQYFEESKNQKDDRLSLRFPVFKEIRTDKDEVSYY